MKVESYTSARIDELLADNKSKSASAVNITSFGVTGDGVTDDTAAINAVITANPGKVIVFPAGLTYRIVTGQAGNLDHSGGIKLNQPGTVLSCYGATFIMDTSTFTNYQMIDVTGADCSIRGGRFIGDLVTHTGTAGEWGYGISVGAGADRFSATDCYATLFWGDGFFVWERPVDVSFNNCQGYDNRRQGISIIDALRPRIIGGAYNNNGRTKFTGPGSGIDLEPDPASTRDVIDAVVTGVLLSGNSGPGMWTSSNGRTLTAIVTGCRAVGNGVGRTNSGFQVDGVGNRTTLSGCEAIGNTLDGFSISGTSDRETTRTKLIGCTAQLNVRNGITDSGTGTSIVGGSSEDNLNSGLRLGGGDSPSVIGISLRGNCTTVVSSDVQLDVTSINASIVGVRATCGTNTTKPAYGFVIRSGATGARLIGCDSSGAHTAGQYLGQDASAVAMPVPGVARPVLTAASTAAQIVTALQALGLSG